MKARLLLSSVALVAVLVVSFMGSTGQASAHSAQANTTHCQNVDKWFIGLGNYHLNNTQVCYDGSHVWQSGKGPDCNVYILPPWSVNTTWCGVYNSGGSYLDEGMNTTLSFAHGGQASGYMRVRYYANGNSDRPYGAG